MYTGVQFQYHKMFMLFNSNMMVATSGAVTAYPSGAPEFTLIFLWDSCSSIFSFLCSFV